MPGPGGGVWSGGVCSGECLVLGGAWSPVPGPGGVSALRERCLVPRECLVPGAGGVWVSSMH